MEEDINLEMIAYNVMEIGYKMGYIEFVDDADTISRIHKDSGWKGPFLENSIHNYVTSVWAKSQDKHDKTYKKISVSNKQYHENFTRSLAG